MIFDLSDLTSPSLYGSADISNYDIKAKFFVDDIALILVNEKSTQTN